MRFQSRPEELTLIDSSIDSTLQFTRHNLPILPGVIRTNSDDFQVDEIQSSVFSNNGEHLWLHIQKRGCNTQYVAQKIADALSIDKRNVSYAGLKDRRAVTTQWFSAQIPGKASPENIDLGDDIKVLDIQRHHKKLRRGQLEGNRFSIVVRNVEGRKSELCDVIDSIRKTGVPNYFGEQRFGIDFGNLPKACLLYTSPSPRDQRGSRMPSSA